MKKIYSLITLLVMLCATTASAQISKPEDLYGKYSMSYKSNGYNASMDITLMESDNKYFKKGMLVGFMGAANNLYINEIDYEAHTITIYSPSIEFYGTTYYLANENGDFPAALDATGKNFNMVISFDPATKTLTFPTMQMGSVDWKEVKFSSLTTYSDITATFKEGLVKESVDWAGTWTVPAGKTDHNFVTGATTYPESFTFTVIEDNGKFYVTEFLGKNIEEITCGGFELKTDGNKATISEYQIVGSLGDGKFQYVTGGYGGDVIFEMKDGKIISKSYGMMIVEGADKTDAYYYSAEEYTNGTEGGNTGEGGGTDVKINYAGTYTIYGANQMLESGIQGAEDVNTSGAFTITEYNGQYYVDAFLGYDTYSMNWGNMELKIDANDPTKATITCNGAEMKLASNLTLADLNGQNNPISVTFNADGTVSIGECCILKDGAFPPVGWFAGLSSKNTSDGISNAFVNGKVEVFAVSGRKLSGLKTGINIVRKNGKVFKVNVK